MFGCAIALLVTASRFPACVWAQRSPAPFETIGLSLSLLGNVNRNRFHDIWRPGAGAEVRVSAPFYAGIIELGGDQLSFESLSPEIPGFRSRFIFLGWRLGLLQGASIRWSGGARLGTYAMRFDADSLPDYRQSENELGTEILSQLGWRPAPVWELSISGRYRTVLTQPRIRHVNLALTLTRDFVTPRWLRAFLD